MAFARFCTESYEKPTRENMDNVFMHLTNYALNKDSELYEENDADLDKGHKRSLGAILRILESEGANSKEFMDEVKSMIVKTVITG
jgi:phosphoenolpyruvate carboxylase